MPENFNDYFANLAAINSEVPSLGAEKAALLQQRKKTKLAKLDPNAVANNAAMEAYNEIYGNSNDSNSIDAMQSSFVQTAGNLADMGYNIADRASDALGGTPFDRTGDTAKEIDKWSNPEYADKMVGYDPTEYNNFTNQVTKDVEQGNYGTALLRSGGHAIESLARSAGSMTELAAGAVLAPETGGASLLPVIAKLAKTAPKAAKALEAMVKFGGDVKKAAIYGSDQSNQYAEAYYKETGHKQSAAEVAENTVLASFLGAIDLNVFKGAAKANSLGTFKRTAVDLAEAIKPTKSVGRAVVNNVTNNALKVLGTAGAEGAQEYLETWHQILASSNKDWADQLVDKTNQTQALVGAIIGAGTGGGLAAIPSSVSVGTTATMAGGSKVVRMAANKGIATAKKAGYKVLSQEDRDNLQAKYDKENKVYEASKKQNKIYKERIQKATSIDELKAFEDPEVTRAIDTVMDKNNQIRDRKKAIMSTEVKDPTDPKELGVDTWTKGKLAEIQASNKSKVPYTVEELKTKLVEAVDESYKPEDLNKNLDKIKNQAIAQYNKIDTVNKSTLEAIRAKDITYKVHSNMYEGLKKQVDKILPKETRDAIVEQAKKGIDLAKVGIDVIADEAKNIDKSAARAVIDDIAQGKANKALYSYSTKQLEDIKKGFEGNEKANAMLNKVIDKKNKVADEFKELKNDDTSLFDKVVNKAGDILSSDIATKVRGLGVITKEFLQDPDNVKRTKNLIKDLENSRKEDEQVFIASGGLSRLNQAKKTLIDSIKNKEEGALSKANRLIKKANKKNSPKLKRATDNLLKQVRVRSKLGAKQTNNWLKEVEAVEKFEKAVDTFDEKLNNFTKPTEKSKSTSKYKNGKLVEEEKVSKSSESIDKEATSLPKNISSEELKNITSQEQIDSLMIKFGFDVDKMAFYISDAEITSLLQSKDSYLHDTGEALQAAKNRNNKEDDEISIAPDRPLTNKELEEINIPDEIC